MQVYQGTDVTSPCFHYDAVVAARLAVFNYPEFSTPLLFCHSMPFTMQIPIINAIGPGCDSVNPCWASSQFAGAVEPEGPSLTELATNALTGSTQIVGEKSAVRAVYAFERYVTKEEDGYPVAAGTAVILLRATQPQVGTTGYIRMSSNTPTTGFAGFHAAEVVSKVDAIASKVMWGVIGRPPVSNAQPKAAAKCMLMYADATFTAAAPMVQMFSWGNTLYFSRGQAAADASGTHAALHGVTTTHYPSISFKKIVYSAKTMTLLPSLLPEFDPTALETGAANIQWSLHALRVSEMAATVYSDAYCSTVCSGPGAPRLSGGNACVWLHRFFPNVAAFNGACGAPGGDTRLQKTLVMVSLGVGVIEFLAIIVALGLFLKGKP